jgi:hypothetical protein
MIALESSRHGTATPTYYLVRSWVKQATHRKISAALYDLAASLERATPAGEGWVVVIDRDRACVCLELSEGDEDEAARGMAILRAVERA